MIRYRARWVLPISAPAIEGGVVAVDGGRIAFVGPANAAPRGTDHDLGDAVLLPGLINAHTHLELSTIRGLNGHDFPSWIAQLQARKKADFDRAKFLAAARAGIAEGLLAGMTTFADTCDSGVSFDAMIETGVRGIMYQEVFGPDPAVAAASLADLAAKIDAMRPRATALVRLGVSPHAPYTVSDDLYRAVARYATDNNLPMAVHIAESSDESAYVTRGEGAFAAALRKRGISVAPRARSSIELLRQTNVLQRRPLLIHCVSLDAADIAAVAEQGAPVAHCPLSNAKLGHGVADLANILNAGITVGLGTDSVASNDSFDVLAEARAAKTTHRLRPGAALSLATLHGARALGLDAEVGSLEPGKSADLAAFPLPAGFARGANVKDDVVSVLPGTRARLVTVAGVELVRDGELAQAQRRG